MSSIPSAEGPTNSNTKSSFSAKSKGGRFGHRPPISQQSAKELESLAYPSTVPRQLKYPRCSVADLLGRTAERFPKQIATTFFGSELTFEEVNSAATRLASWLQSQGIHTGERVGILLPNCPEYLIGLNAVWRAGGIAVAVSPLSSPREVGELLSLTQCRTVITLDMLGSLLCESSVQRRLIVSLRSYLPHWKKILYSIALKRRTGFTQTQVGTSSSQCEDTPIWKAIEETKSNPIPVEIVAEKDAAYILSTGGTTGDPKAVTLSHQNIVANAWQQMHWISSSGIPVAMGQESMLSVLPFFHSYGMSTMLATGMAIGAKLHMQPRFDVRKTIAAIERERPTIFHAVPAMLSAINQRLRRHPADLSSIKWVISGGASLPPDTAFEFASHSGATVVEGYGLSEASPVTHVGPLDGSNVTGTIGLPLPDTECRIVAMDDETQEADMGEVGELLVRGPQVMLGYWNNHQATEQTISNGWLRTGDLARLTPQGFYEIVDRKKDLIITSGFNVYPADVEQALRECPLIKDVAVVGVPDAKRGEIVKAFVVLNKGYRWNVKKLDQFCRSRLAKHRQPKMWEQVEGDLPRNFLGKVLRKQLRLC
ncbi:MAG: AMP-binding protein [Aureliella sp.]